MTSENFKPRMIVRTVACVFSFIDYADEAKEATQREEILEELLENDDIELAIDGKLLYITAT